MHPRLQAVMHAQSPSHNRFAFIDDVLTAHDKFGAAQSNLSGGIITG
jgi:hypothetical protein